MIIDFETIMEFSGTTGNEPLSATELKNLVPPGMEFVEERNVNTIVTKTVGKMHASLGIEAAMDSHGRRIEGCVSTDCNKI
jgi:hypothetical protein